MRLFQKEYHSMTDEQLVIALAGGDKRAFDLLYERYAKALLFYFSRMLWNDREKAEDFLHDLFTKIIHRPELFDTTRSFKTWIYSVANNMCKNEYKKKEVRKTSVQPIPDYALISNSGQTEQEVDKQLLEEAFGKALVNIDEKHKEVFEMRHFDGFSIKEIATTLDINEGTVKSRLFYATKQLAKLLVDYQPIKNDYHG
jgi:RNA polymerase sigma-70 factor (ECF subfamily)